MSEILKTININKSFPIGEKTVKIIDGISLSIQKGEFVTIMGRSGSGKSTLLNLLMGLIKVDSGDVFVDDQNISELNENQLCKFRASKFGIVFQDNNLISTFNVEENIITPLLITHQKVDNEYLNHLLEFVGLSNHRYHNVNKLSGGQKQRVAISRALITRPLIVFADEPTGSLDSTSALEIMNLFKRINKEFKTTIIQVSHSLQCAELTDRIIDLADGKII